MEASARSRGPCGGAAVWLFPTPGPRPPQGTRGPGEHHLPWGWGDGRGARLGVCVCVWGDGSNSNGRRRPSPSKDLFEADKKERDSFSVPGWALMEEARLRTAPSWRAARRGRPAGFHRTSRCRRSPAGSLQRSSRRPVMVDLPLLLLLLLLPPLPGEPPHARLCQTSCLLTGENNLGSRAGNWIRTRRQDEKLMFCGSPPSPLMPPPPPAPPSKEKWK